MLWWSFLQLGRTLSIFRMVRNLGLTLGLEDFCKAYIKSWRNSSNWWSPIRGTRSFPTTTEVINSLVYSMADRLKEHDESKMKNRMIIEITFPTVTNEPFLAVYITQDCWRYWRSFIIEGGVDGPKFALGNEMTLWEDKIYLSNKKRLLCALASPKSWLTKVDRGTKTCKSRETGPQRAPSSQKSIKPVGVKGQSRQKKAFEKLDFSFSIQGWSTMTQQYRVYSKRIDPEKLIESFWGAEGIRLTVYKSGIRACPCSTQKQNDTSLL